MLLSLLFLQLNNLMVLVFLLLSIQKRWYHYVILSYWKMSEDNKMVITGNEFVKGQAIQWPNEKEHKDKTLLFLKHYTEN